jgi:predicted glycosyltransferase
MSRRGVKSMASERLDKTIWIDLDNSPHVPFFAPIMRSLEARGYRIFLTARDCSQTCSLADLFQFNYRRIGHHYGKHKLLKAWGTIVRGLQLGAAVGSAKPDLAVSHGSRSQLLAATVLGIPSMLILDYEFASPLPGISPTWVMAPDVIPVESIRFRSERVLRYSGIKEDVYVPGFKRDPLVRTKLGIDPDVSIITIRPPAEEAHYHNSESETLLAAVIDLLSMRPNTKMLMLPRNRKQAAELRKLYSELISNGTIVIPDGVIDGLNLIWESDAVVSGGGTMNREAAAMEVPVYSIFRGPTGAVDRYLVKNERLVMLETVDDVRTKLVVHARRRAANAQFGNRAALLSIVDHIAAAIEGRSQGLEKKTA